MSVYLSLFPVENNKSSTKCITFFLVERKNFFNVTLNVCLEITFLFLQFNVLVAENGEFFSNWKGLVLDFYLIQSQTSQTLAFFSLFSFFFLFFFFFAIFNLKKEWQYTTIQIWFNVKCKFSSLEIVILWNQQYFISLHLPMLHSNWQVWKDISGSF